MPRYVIEREISEVGTFGREALREAAHKSNGALADMKAKNKDIESEHSYVAGAKTFCIYLADDEGLIHEHAERSGLGRPVGKSASFPMSQAYSASLATVDWPISRGCLRCIALASSRNVDRSRSFSDDSGHTGAPG